MDDSQGTLLLDDLAEKKKGFLGENFNILFTGSL